MHKAFYSVQAYFEGFPDYLACYRAHSRREASRVYGNMLTDYPGAIVTLNRRVFRDGRWVSTTNHNTRGRVCYY